MSNLIIFYNLLNIWLLLLIDLDILTTILPKTDVPYPWIWLLYCKRTFYCNDSKIMEFETIDTKNSSTAYVVVYKLIA